MALDLRYMNTYQQQVPTEERELEQELAWERRGEVSGGEGSVIWYQ